MADDIELQGKCSAIDTNARTFSIRDIQDAIHPFKWIPELDPVMKKWQSGYYLTVKYNPDTHAVKNVTYGQEGKEFWAKEHKGSAGGNRGQPRNERLIAVQCLLKAYTDLWPNCHTPDSVSFADAREEILSAVEGDIGRVMKAGGA